MPSTPQRASSRHAAAKPQATKLTKERAYFTELLLANHFGTIAGSEIAPKTSAKNDTAYEQLMCVGYNPGLKRLDAVVNIKQAIGYSGDQCTPGSLEYVKFFISSDDGSSWAEEGTVSFPVWDVPGEKPLEYAASLYVNLAERCCRYENLVRVRAILSWSVPPTGPDDPVVWGNALDAEIQVEPIPSDTLLHLLECAEIKVPLEQLSQLADLEQPVKFGTELTLSAAELHELYKDAKVEPHRYLYTSVKELLKSPATLSGKLADPNFKLFPGLELTKEIDIGKLVAFLIDPQGNETYEQLGCVGYNEKTNELVATIDVKLSSGYSGGLCTAGSKEFVAFWVDWGSGWNLVGTTAVTVHDIPSIPAGGLRYSASLPFPQTYTHRRPCGDGPVEATIRAVLSWATPPSPTDPFAVPVWGGHAQTRILLEPGNPVPDTGGPHLLSLAHMSVGDIAASGLTKPGTDPAGHGYHPDESPFGGRVTIGGVIFNRFQPGVIGGPGIFYKIWILTDAGLSFMNHPIDVPTFQTASGTYVDVPVTPTFDGWYAYVPDMTNPAAEIIGIEDTIGWWDSFGNGKAQIWLETNDAIGPLGSTAATTIQLDNENPVSHIWITSAGGSCGEFHVGDTIEGGYSATDNERLAAVGFSVEPSGNPVAHIVTSPPDPLSQSGTWSLNTGTPTEMTTCGYVIRLDGADNTIVNSGWVGHDGPSFVGFCLKQ